MLNEFHVTSESDNRIRRNIIRNDIGALDLFAKKTSSLSIDILPLSARSDGVREQQLVWHGTAAHES